MKVLLMGALVALVVGAAEAAPAPVTLYLEAERFDVLGGWTVDAQFRQQMGSTYLLAAGIGVPVADATTKVSIPRAGKYHLWVRCKDWDKTSPGAFQVLVAGRPSAVTFGTQKKGWSWIAGGAFDLPEGPATVALHDLTGYYGRCDALILTTDARLTPPDDLAGIARLRDRVLGRRETETLDYDFVVVGGGYGGICSAVQAARLGLNTALIQNRPVLGGNSSEEINVGPGGACPHTSRFRETGIDEEICEARIQPDVHNNTEAINRVVKDVPNLWIYPNTEGTRPVMAGKRKITAIEAENVISGQRYVFRAPLFADCTGDGSIAAAAGCTYRVGQEARGEFGESYAPEKANRNTMGTSMMHRSARMDTPQPYTPPAFAFKFDQEYFTKRRESMLNGTWWIEYGGLLDTIKDAEQIRDELLRVIFGAFDWAKNGDPETRDKAANYKLVWVPTVGGKRESRRIMGDIILNQNDVESAKLFPDRVAFGGWPIDLHPSVGIFGKDVPPFTPFSLKQPYSIPYRILYAKDVDNLFLAGRDVSVTHVALGSTRLMQTIGTMGQAVGAAASLCRKYGAGPRALYPAHIAELQQLLLKWDAYIPEVKDEDPGDLCRGATVTASSVAGSTIARVGADPVPTKEAPCTMARGQTIVAPEKGQKTVSLRLRAAGPDAATAELHVEKGDGANDKTQPLWKLTASVPAGGFRWVQFTLPDALVPGEPYFFWLAPNPALTWSICEDAAGERVYGQPGSWTHSGGVYALKPWGAVAHLGSVGPDAALDGLKWPLKGQCHQWRSDPEQGLPQWLEVDFHKPVRLNTVYLTFDTNLSGRFASGRPAAEVTAEEYRLLYRDGGAWKTAFTERGNWHRFRRHTFATVTTDKIRLEVLSSRNGKEARVYEIRAYEE